MTAKRIFWSATLVGLVVYIAIVMWSLPRISAEANGLRPFDLRPGGYDLEAALAFLTALSETGRSWYLGAQGWLDLAYPLLLFVSLASGAVWLLSGKSRLGIAVIVFSAAMGMGFDFLENSRVAGMLNMVPTEVTAEQVAAASRATILKSVFTTVAMVCLLVAAVWRGWSRWRARA